MADMDMDMDMDMAAAQDRAAQIVGPDADADERLVVAWALLLQAKEDAVDVSEVGVEAVSAGLRQPTGRHLRGYWARD
jgi:hypothetical protein